MRLSEFTRGLVESRRTSLAPFFTAGYPDERTFADLVVAASRSGADVIEIGVPFSDPIADGPVIQAASTAALAGGMTLPRALGLVSELSKEVSTPFIIMSYVNPLLAFGVERFSSAADEAGISGVILPDVSFEESGPFRTIVRDGYIDLLAPTSSAERVEAIASGAVGFLYLVSLTGVTGARRALSSTLPEFVARVRPKASAPLYVGFGVSTPGHAADVAKSADGVIIGSKLIQLIGENTRTDAVRAVASFLTDVRAAIDNGAAT